MDFAMAVIGAVLAAALLTYIIVKLGQEDILNYEWRSRCVVSGKIFASYICLPCPCHGIDKERVVARWRGHWQVALPAKEK